MMGRKKILLKGRGASAGKAEGKVKIVLDPSEVNKLEEGDILVAKITNPLFTTAIIKASAIITDIGGTLSHAAIVAREMGIPAIVGTKKATKILSDGQEIVVDGSAGVIHERAKR